MPRLPQTIFEVALMKICTLQEAGAYAELRRSFCLGGILRQRRCLGGEVQRLQQRIDALERKIEQLLQSGVRPEGGAAANPDQVRRRAWRESRREQLRRRSGTGGAGGR